MTCVDCEVTSKKLLQEELNRGVLGKNKGGLTAKYATSADGEVTGGMRGGGGNGGKQVR